MTPKEKAKELQNKHLYCYLNPMPREYYYEPAEEYYYTFINPLGKNEKSYK